MDAEGKFEPRFGVAIGSTTYAWEERVDATAIALRKLRDRVQTAINIAALVAATVSFLAFALLALFASGVETILEPAFWFSPSSVGFFLSLTALLACFVFFRLVESTRNRIAMPKRTDAATPAVAPIAGLPSGNRVNAARLFSTESMKSLEDAFSLAERYKHAKLLPLHLFAGSLSSTEVAVAFGRLDITFDSVREPLTRRLALQEVGNGVALSEAAEETLLGAFVNAFEQGRRSVSPLEIFYEAYKRDEFLKELFYDLKVDEHRLANMVAWIRISGKMRERYENFRRAAAYKPTGPMNRAMTSVATPALDALSEDLTAAAVHGRLPMLVGRERELEDVFRVIEGGRQSVVLVGPEGTGKSAVLAGIAELMVEERVPKVLQDKRLVSLSIPNLISGASPAEAQERLMRVLIDVARSRNIILAIPNLEQLTGMSQGGEQTADLASMLVDFLQRSGTFAIATATPQDYAAAIERSTLGRVFEKVNVGEPESDAAIQILESKIGGIEYEHKVIFSYEAVERAVLLSDRYMHETYLPEKAIAICREAALSAFKARGEDTLVTGEDVAEIIARKTSIPVTQVSQDEKDKLLQLEERMHGRVIGQEEAVKAVSSALRRARAELTSQKRPIAVFLFLGPTGVGKTELAKTVAEAYFGSEEAMLRFDMSEYQDTQSIHRLIGVPGSNEGGQLTEAVRRKPFAILLLDELEKASPEILNLFLQVFDDGRLTDAAGRTVDFTNTIIVATSNAGATYIQDAVREGKPLEEIKTRLLEQELKGIYRPEFLNRFDGVIVFRPLTMDDVSQIAYLMVDKVGKQLEPKGIYFRATDEAVMELAQKGYDPAFGARPLRRVVQEEVDNAIASALLEGRVQRRDTIVLKPGGQIDIEKGAAL